MPIDIKIFLDNYEVNYEVNIKDQRVYFCFDIPDGYKKLKINYDFNIYEDLIIENHDYSYESGYIEINLEKEKINHLEFSLMINYKYYIKLVYHHVNFKYKKEELINNLEFLYKVNNEDEVLSIIKILKELNIEDKFLYYEIDKMIIDILTDNKYYEELINRMNDYDLLNIITYYLAVPNPYSIDQEKLDELVLEAEKHDYASENIWRLAMNYDRRNYDFNKIEEYFANSKDLYYLYEYLSGVSSSNEDNLVNLIIKTKDKEYIKEIVSDNFMNNILSKKSIEKLKEEL